MPTITIPRSRDRLGYSVAFTIAATILLALVTVIALGVVLTGDAGIIAAH